MLWTVRMTNVSDSVLESVAPSRSLEASVVK